MRWRDPKGYGWTIPDELEELIHLSIKALKKYLSESPTVPTTLKGNLMADYQLTTGDSVTITFVDTDDVTGAVVTPDAGSLTVVSSNSGDTVTLATDGSLSAVLTAGTTTGTGYTVTANATVNGVDSTPWVGTYDVVAGVAPDATTLTGTFGLEAAPVAATDVVGNNITS
jgi:hypothetical protein